MARIAVNGTNLNVMALPGPADRALPPVVVLRGLIMDNLSSYYFTLAPGIAELTDVIVYDLRGHGLSDRPPSGYTLDDTSLAADLRAEPPMTAERLASINCPALCLYGDSSDILDRAETLSRDIPNAQLVVFDGCTHSVLMEAPDEIEVELRTWLSKLALVATDPAHR